VDRVSRFSLPGADQPADQCAKICVSEGVGGIVDVVIRLEDDKHYRLSVQDYGREFQRKIKRMCLNALYHRTSRRRNGIGACDSPGTCGQWFERRKSN